MNQANLRLVIDNPHPHRREETTLARMGYLGALFGAGAFAVGFWWGVTTLLFSLR